MRPFTLVFALAVLAIEGKAVAGPAVTLNGVTIDGVTSQKFDNATVVIDDKGDIHIEAKGYTVRIEDGSSVPGPRDGTSSSQTSPARADATTTVPAPSLLPAASSQLAAPSAPSGISSDRQAGPTRRYFLATEYAAPGTAYDIAVFINAQWVREVKATEPPVVMEITKYMKLGANKIVVAATKRAERPSTSQDVVLRVIVGDGNIVGDHVALEDTLAEITRTAAETDDHTDEFVVQAR